MRKLTFIAILLLSNFVFNLCAQDQTITGNLVTEGNISLKTETTPAPFNQWGKKLYFGYGNENHDGIYFSRVNLQKDYSELRLVLGDDGSEKLTIGCIHYSDNKWKENITLQGNGRIGIGIPNPVCPLDVNGQIQATQLTVKEQIKATQLDVNGTIRSKEVKIEATGWADFVFDENYKLPELSEVENHIKAHKHLPDLPSEKQVVEEGVNVVEMQAKLLQKIEELTLYVIKQDKKIEQQNMEIKTLKQQLYNIIEK